MNMFIRIYYEGCYKDISLNGLHSYSIGNGDADDFRISTADLNEQHILITQTSNGYGVQCI